MRFRERIDHENLPSCAVGRSRVSDCIDVAYSTGLSIHLQQLPDATDPYVAE